MDTLHKLQTIEPSKFEKLVLQYLRRRDSQLYGLIAAGINEEDRFTSCRVDGILYFSVSSDLPCCIAVACNVYKREKLRGKWLGVEGDINNAAEELQKLRLDEPRIVCKLYLATNKRLLKSNKDLELTRDVIRKGKDNGIEIQFVEASQLEDFLNIDIDGQYIGEELLQIPAKRLGENLLRKIADDSLAQHQLTFGIGQNEPGKEIIRDAQSQVMAVLEQSTASLLGLRGASGTGKSTLLRQVGREINKRGGITLWVPAEEIVPNTSISNLFLQVLQRFHPSLNHHAGDDAMRQAQQVPGGLVLLVDDVNRLPTPQQALKAIEVWEGWASGRGMSGSQSSHLWLRFVVPFWLGQLAAQPESPTQENAKWEFVELQSYSELEKARLASLLSENHPEAARQVIDALNGDPFLCGLASADIAIPLGSRSDLIRRNFEDVLDRAATKVVRTNKEIATPKEFVTAIEKLVELMLWAEEPEPHWEQVREALGDRTADLLHILAKTNMLGWIDQSETCEFWRWKHDRLRDALVGRWLANNVLPQVLEGNVSGEIQTWLSDPGLAEAWALALVFLSKANIRAKALAVLSEHQPLALAEVLRLNLFPNESNLRQLIVEGLRRTLVGFEARTREYVSNPQRLVLAKLAQTNDSLVLEVTENLHRDWDIWAARLRNGDISAGLEWISHLIVIGRKRFLPGVHILPLEQAIEAFKVSHDYKRDNVVNELAQALKLAHLLKQPELFVAGITFAGYLAWPELSQLVGNVWNTVSNLSKLAALTILAIAVWTLSRCSNESMQAELETALLLVRELSDEERVEGNARLGSERYWQFIEPLRMARRWSITSSSAETWVRVATVHPDLRQKMCYILRDIDHPMTQEAYARWVAKPVCPAIPFSESIDVDPLQESNHEMQIPAAPATRNRLWEIIERESQSDEQLRRIAFMLWKRSAQFVDLGKLNRIPSSDLLFDEVLKVRLKLRDKTAAEPLIERMQSEPRVWCGYAPLLHGAAGVFEALLKSLEVALNDPLGRSNSIVQHLPEERVKELVKKKQSLLFWTLDKREAVRKISSRRKTQKLLSL